MSRSDLTDFEVAYVDQWLETHKRSAFVYLLLRAIEGSPKWSGELVDYVDETTGGVWTVDEQSLYRALRRLEKQGLVQHTKDASPGPGGKRKVFTLTSSGSRVFEQLRSLAGMYGDEAMGGP